MAVIRKRKLCSMKEPLENDIHKLITRVATSDDVPTAIDDVRVTLREKIPPDEMEAAIDVIEATVTKCIKYIPHRVHVYATLIRQVGEDNKALADKILATCLTEFQAALSSGKITQVKNFLRLFGWLSRSDTLNTIDASLVSLLSKLSDDLSTSHKDTICYLTLATLPWFPLSTVKVCLPLLTEYFSRRQRSQSTEVVRPVHVQQFNLIQNSATRVESEPDLLDLMFKELTGTVEQDQFDTHSNLLSDTDGSADRLLSWKANDVEIPIVVPAEILFPILPSALHLFHTLDTNKNPIYNDSRESCNLFNPADEMVFLEREATTFFNRLVVRELTHDVIRCYNSDMKQLAAVLSEALPAPKGFTKMSQAAIVIDAIFGSTFALPVPAIPLAGYNSLLYSLVSPDGSPFALPLVEAFDWMLDSIPVLDSEISYRFLELFSSYLSMVSFRWTLWDTINLTDSDFRTATPKKLFNIELMNHLTRNSSRRHLATCIPPEVDKARVLQEADSGIRYKFMNPGVPLKEQADELLKLLRVKNETTAVTLSAADADEVLTAIKGIESATEFDYCDILMNCILFFGSEGVAYERYLLVKYSPVLKQLVSDDNKHFFVTVTGQFWENSPHRMVTSVKSLLQLEIITPLHVVNWLLTDDIAAVYERYFLWEVVNTALDSSILKIKRHYEDLIDLEGASSEVDQIPDAALAKKARRQIQRKITKIESVINDVCVPDFRVAIKSLFKGLGRKIQEHYTDAPTILQRAETEQDQRRVSARNYLWCRATLGNLNAIGRKYLPFFVPFLDELHEEVFRFPNVPEVVLNIFASWRPLRGRQLFTSQGITAVLNEEDPLQQEVARRMTSCSGSNEGDNIFDRIDKGLAEEADLYEKDIIEFD